MSRRRSCWSLLVVLGLLATLSACGQGDAQTTPGPATPDTTGAEGRADYPLTLRSPWGETVLPKAPTRVATVSATSEDLDALLALGVTPVFAMDTLADAPWLTSAQASALQSTRSGGRELNVETLAASRPDLIVVVAGTSRLDKPLYDKLATIAPVLTAPKKLDAFQLGWKDNLRIVAETIDRAPRADRLVQKVEKVFDNTRSAHPEFARVTAAFAVNYGRGDGVEFFSPKGSNVARVLRQLGFRPSLHADEFVKDTKINDEQLTKLDGDLLFVGENVHSSSERLDRDRLFRGLDVYRNGGYVPYTFDDSGTNWIAWGLRSSSALNLPWVVHQLATPASKALADR